MVALVHFEPQNILSIVNYVSILAVPTMLMVLTELTAITSLASLDVAQTIPVSSVSSAMFVLKLGSICSCAFVVCVGLW